MLNKTVKSSNVTSISNNIKALIGCFDLDPNRVLDLLLDAYEHKPTSKSFIKL